MLNVVGFFSKGRKAPWHLWDGQQTLCRSHGYLRLKPTNKHRFVIDKVDRVCEGCEKIMKTRYQIDDWLKFKTMRIGTVEKFALVNGQLVKYKAKRKKPAQ